MNQSNLAPALTIEEMTDPKEIDRHRSQSARFERNLDWLQTHWGSLTSAKGRWVAVANQQPFIADSADEAWAWVRTRHPDEDGAVVMFVPLKKAWWAYANQGRVGGVRRR